MGQPAARVGDMHTCPMQTPAFPSPIPHVGGPVMPPGVPNVLIGGMPAAVVGGMCVCVAPVMDVIAKGSLGVMIGGMPAARMGDMTAHGGTITVGCPTVLIGDLMPGAPPVLVPPVVIVTPSTGEKKSGSGSDSSGSAGPGTLNEPSGSLTPQDVERMLSDMVLSPEEHAQLDSLRSASENGEAYCEECERLSKQVKDN